MLSAYRIGTNHQRIWLVTTAKVADPKVPTTLPISSPVLTFDEARALAEQILAAIPAEVPA